MILPAKVSSKQLALPFWLVYWSCRLTRNDWLGVFLIPVTLVAVGVALLLQSHLTISKGLWLALLWTSITFAMLYYGQNRIQRVFDHLQGVIPNTTAAKNREKEVRARAFAHYNNRYYYVVSAVTIAITLPSMSSTFISHYSAIPLRVWGWTFFICVAFIGGYGMACVVAFNKIVHEIISATPFEPNPHHPDLFMGLKPLGTLAVANAFFASSSSLLFPLIFETIHGGVFAPLGYSIFAIIMVAVLASFFGPLFIVKNKIQRAKFAAIIALEEEYQTRLAHYKKAPTSTENGVLQVLMVENAKLKEIRLFPFETNMIFQVLASVLLPIVILFLEILFKK
jgi:hypothetical protein